MSADLNYEALGALIDADVRLFGLDGEIAYDALALELQATKDQLAQSHAQKDEAMTQLQSAFNLIESLNQANSELRSAISRVDAALEAVRKVRET